MTGFSNADADLTGFSDADFAGDVDARKSTTGVIFFLVDSPITWQSMKQNVVPNPPMRQSISLLQTLPAKQYGWLGCCLKCKEGH